jgi:hypothetical protein
MPIQVKTRKTRWPGSFSLPLTHLGRVYSIGEGVRPHPDPPERELRIATVRTFTKQ